MSGKAVLTIDGKVYELPTLEGTEHEKAIDIRKLRADTGYITLDSGYGNTGACQSDVTFIDGDLGILRYRGYPIEEVCEKCEIEEVIFLLLYKKLPTPAETKAFSDDLKKYSVIDKEKFTYLFKSMPKDAHPMSMLSASVSVLATHEPNEHDNKSPEKTDIAIRKMIAKFPVIAAAAYRAKLGKEINDSDQSLSYSANFLHLMFSEPGKKYKILPEVEDIMSKLFILHADHEQNCSTSAVRLVGSSQASLFASVVAGIAALSGSAHGGANQEVLEMLSEINHDGGGVDKFIAKAKDKNDSFKLMGFGHRVYKNYDPRANIIKKNCDGVLAKIGVNDPLLGIAQRLEKAALGDEYFVSRKLFPNVDFYSGIIYKAMGIPVDMFTVIFAIGRLSGWITQWKEMHALDDRIARPRQIYIGENKRPLKK
jgi:citrate synthase